MDIVIFILFIILTIGLIAVALVNGLPFWSIFAAAACIILAAIAFTSSIQTHIPQDKNVVVIDANTTLETYSYQMANYSNDSSIIFIAWASIAMFFIVIVNLVIRWNEVNI